VTFLEQLGLQHPVVQAGMGGGIAGGELAGAVSAAGALGTVGTMPPDRMAAALARAREVAGAAPVAANLLVPFATRAHVDAFRRATVPVVVLHAGVDRQLVDQLRNNGSIVLQTVGTPVQARRALDYGVDALVVQGREAGGHLVGVEPALNALARIRDEVKPAATKPLLLAGGIADAADVERATGAGAVAAVAGTRFLLTEEAAAHAEYKRRVMDAERTVETQLFGFGWPMRHRVVPNAATERWCRAEDLGPRLLRTAYRMSVPIARLPLSITGDLVKFQRAALPLFGPNVLIEGMPGRLADATALYAGETARRLDSIVPAATAVTLLTGAPPAPRPRSPTIRSS
jgi:nitronate monooxygenase